MNLSNAAAASIGRSGEQFIVELLAANGWYIDNWNTQGAGATDIVASKSWSRILVQVKTAVSPRVPSVVAPFEKLAICNRAERNRCKAYLAQVILDPHTLNPVWWKFIQLK